MRSKIPRELRDRLFSEGKFYVTEINEETIRSLEDWILSNRIGKSPKTEFTIVINSSGGLPEWIVYFASFVRTLSPNVRLTGVTFGECGSSALALLQCCHKRIAVKHSCFFIHNMHKTIRVNCQDVKWNDLAKKIERSKKLEKELVKLQSKRAGMTVSAWRTLAREGESIVSEIHANEAKKLGLIDAVVDEYPIF